MPDKTYTLNDLDRNWVKFALNQTKASLQRQRDSERVSETVREAVRKDLKMLDETTKKFD